MNSEQANAVKHPHHRQRQPRQRKGEKGYKRPIRRPYLSAESQEMPLKAKASEGRPSRAARAWSSPSARPSPTPLWAGPRPSPAAARPL